MLEGLQDPQSMPSQSAPSQPANAGRPNLDDLYGAALHVAGPPAQQQSDDPFGLGGLSVPAPAVPSHSYGSQPPPWSQGSHLWESVE